MKYKVYTPFPSGNLYLGADGADLIVEEESLGEAMRTVVNWIFETSNYSKEMTERWLEEHPLVLEKFNG